MICCISNTKIHPKCSMEIAPSGWLCAGCPSRRDENEDCPSTLGLGKEDAANWPLGFAKAWHGNKPGRGPRHSGAGILPVLKCSHLRTVTLAKGAKGLPRANDL